MCQALAMGTHSHWIPTTTLWVLLFFQFMNEETEAEKEAKSFAWSLRITSACLRQVSDWEPELSIPIL